MKPGVSSGYYEKYYHSFMLFLVVWVFTSYVTGKYNFPRLGTWILVFRKVLVSNLIIFFIITSMMYLFRSFYYSRFIVLGTVAMATAFELLIASIYRLLSHTEIHYENGSVGITVKEPLLLEKRPVFHFKKMPAKPDLKLREDYLKNEIGLEAFNFMVSYAALDSPNTLIVSSTTSFNIDAQIQPAFECIVNVQRVNDFRYINKYFESVNAKLPIGGLFIDYFESKSMRKKRILNKFPAGFNYLYYTLDFVVKRVFPKFSLTKKLYFLLTRGENRVLSKAETYGRLYSCGFEILDEQIIDKCLYFIAIKVKQPLFPKHPSYGPLVALERIGQGGKAIVVYKMRTMHPFAEYLQDYVYNKEGLQEGGKFKNDFRVTTIGRIMRTLWLDELPMLINLVKGDLKLVGVRPLSRQYFKLYSEELQHLRIKSKPGLIPPFYVDYPKTLDEIIASELKYLKSYERHPFRTDWVYFWKALFNILFRKYRSS
jgi:lipopolysaccharide/colanic/teichoic acid biosynthesis glycosyltransferase